MQTIRPRYMVIGIGNPDRGDDAAGRAVARCLQAAPPAGAGIVEHDGEATSLLAHLENAAAAVLIDACVSGAPPGAVRRFDVTAAPLPRDGFRLSTHGLGLPEAVELARALGQMPRRCVVYAIEAGSFDSGAGLSPPVATAVRETAERVRAEFRRIASH